MNVQIDKSDFPFQENLRSLGEVFAAIDKHLDSRKRCVVELKLDGELLEIASIAEVASHSLEQHSVLEIGTAKSSDVVDGHLNVVDSALPNLADSLRKSGQMLAGPDAQVAMEELDKILGAWDAMQTCVRQATTFLEIDVKSTEIGGVTLESWYHDLNQCFEKLGKAIQSDDKVLLRDLLVYELAPRAERMKEVVKHLQAVSAEKLKD